MSRRAAERLMKTSDFDYHLPARLIAQHPLEPRDISRLMVLCRKQGAVLHRHFFDIVNYLHEGDVLVLNDSRVIPARLYGFLDGRRLEVLLLRHLGGTDWETLVGRGRSARVGAEIVIGENGATVRARVLESRQNGVKVLSFSDGARLPGLGQVPLPPYIREPLDDPERYQTVYARAEGSVAAPTAGLHFTPSLLDRIKRQGVRCVFVTLHIGLDTFRPVHGEDPLAHPIHREYGVLGPDVAGELASARAEGRRIICVGTTTVRILEQAARASPLQPFEGWADLFILPGHRFRLVDGLVTNFHLPRSTLLMLVSAFAGRELVLSAYQEAASLDYRFYSFGDAMLIL